MALFVAHPLTLSGQTKKGLSHSEKMRAHARLYAQYQNGKSLRAAQESRVIEPMMVLEGPQTEDEFLRTRVCPGDAVVLGDVLSADSAFSEDESFIFTDYSFRVVEIFKDSVAAIPSVGESIDVTRPGGTVLVNGVPQSVTVGDVPPLRVGTRYLLSLKYLPDSDSYSSSGLALFSVKNSRAEYVGRTGLPPEDLLRGDWAAFRTKLRAFIGSSCPGGAR
jgi:hypothetical protein